MARNMALEKWVHRISLDSGEFMGFRRIFQILSDPAFWEKVLTLRNFETSGGHIAIF
jgi:hypothetical protein